MKRILVIINPISGTKGKNDLPSMIGDAYSQSDTEVFATYTKAGGHAHELAQQAVEMGLDMVIAIGGDGTINEVASALVGSETKLGIVPSGSGNGLARALGIPMNASKAIQALVEGESLCIDSCEVNGRPFFCTAGMGFDAEVSQRFSEVSTRGPISYVRTAIAEYQKFEPEQYRITLDKGVVLETPAFVLAIANASQYGNNAYIAPKASMTDGQMDLIVLRPFTVMEMPQVVYQLFTRKLEDNNHQASYKVRHLVIERTKPGYIHVDGDPIAMPERLVFKVVPRSLYVIVPKDSEELQA